MRLLPAIALLLCTTPLAAQSGQEKQEPEKPVTSRDVSVRDVVSTPASDLNIGKQDVPALLVAAQSDPYVLGSLRRCSQIAAAVGELDAVLGDDVDLTGDDPAKRTSATRLTQSAVGSFIPFRGLIREISGANASDRRLALAIQAGYVRRAFLKGVGLQKGCRYPARPATEAMLTQIAAERAATKESERAEKGNRQKDD